MERQSRNERQNENITSVNFVGGSDNNNDN